MNSQFALALAAGWAIWALVRALSFKSLKIIVVIDGDTYEAIDEKGKHFRLRIRGCDCPETDQAYGAEARQAVHALLHGKWVSARMHGRDRYKRHLVSIKLEGKDLAGTLLRQGLAYPMPGAFSTYALAARLSGLGLWSAASRAKPWDAPSRRKGLWGWVTRTFLRPGTQRRRR